MHAGQRPEDPQGVPTPFHFQRVARGLRQDPGGAALGEINLARLSINYRTPEAVMAEAKPAIRAVPLAADVPTSIRQTDAPVVHARVRDLGSILETWLAENADGIACIGLQRAVDRHGAMTRATQQLVILEGA
jgi:hypothetical protein